MTASISASSAPAARIDAGPDHEPYGLFCVAAGHQLGFNDLKANEVARDVNAIAGTTPEPFGFRAGLRIQTLVETIQASSREKQWKNVPEQSSAILQ